MTQLRVVTAMAAALAGAVMPAVGMGAASATPSPWEYYSDEYGPDVSFCGDLIQHGTAEGKVRFTAQGPDSLPYYYDRAAYTETWTNPDTGEFVTVAGWYTQDALHVTDNGDGTVTILFSGPGRHTVYSQTGEVIARETGVSAFKMVFDQAGTPTDPSDDEFVDFLGFVKQSPTHFDLCSTITEAIG